MDLTGDIRTGRRYLSLKDTTFVNTNINIYAGSLKIQNCTIVNSFFSLTAPIILQNLNIENSYFKISDSVFFGDLPFSFLQVSGQRTSVRISNSEFLQSNVFCLSGVGNVSISLVVTHSRFEKMLGVYFDALKILSLQIFSSNFADIFQAIYLHATMVKSMVIKESNFIGTGKITSFVSPKLNKLGSFVFISNANLCIENSVFAESSVDSNHCLSGFINIRESKVQIRNVSFIQNAVQQRLISLHGSQLSVFSSFFKENMGSCIHTIDSQITIDQSYFLGNRFAWGNDLQFGVVATQNDTLFLNGSLGSILLSFRCNVKSNFSSNWASFGAVLFAANASDIQISECQFLENRAENTGGFAKWIKSTGESLLWPSGWGGVIYVSKEYHLVKEIFSSDHSGSLRTPVLPSKTTAVIMKEKVTQFTSQGRVAV